MFLKLKEINFAGLNYFSDPTSLDSVKTSGVVGHEVESIESHFYWVCRFGLFSGGCAAVGSSSGTGGL